MRERRASLGRQRGGSIIWAVNTAQIIETIDAEVQRLRLVRALLDPSRSSKPAEKSSPKPGKRQVSAAGRARMAAAQKARWAAAKAAKG